MEEASPAHPVPSTVNRRTALRWAAAAVPTVAALLSPALAGTAHADMPIRPTAENTGPLPGTVLSGYYGDIVVTTPGTVLDSLDIWGFILVRAADVVIRNCIVRGSGPGSYNSGLVDCNHPAALNTLIEHCRLVPAWPSVWLDGVIGKGYTARWNDVLHVVDGFGVYNAADPTQPANVTIESNLIHDLAYFSVDPNHEYGPTHNDGIQIQGGSNIRIVGNNISCFMATDAGDQNYPDRNVGQAIVVQPALAPVTGSTISYNWIDGGQAGIFFTNGNFGSQWFGTCEWNRFGRYQYLFPGNSTYQIRVQYGVLLAGDVFTNTFDDNSQYFQISKAGGIRIDF